MTQTGFQLGGDAPERYQQTVAPIMAPFIEAVIDRAGVPFNGAVLDVACGTGFLTRRVAEAAGPEARVVGLDVNPGMLARARAVSGDRPDPRLEWHEASALAMPFGDAEFDAVLCQQGIQFFPGLEQGAVEMHRVLRPGGRVVATFWANLAEQTFFRVQNESLHRVIGQTMAEAFALNPEQAQACFLQAGFHDLQLERIEASVTLPPMNSYAVTQVGALPPGRLLAEAPDESRATYVRDMETGLAHWGTESTGYSCPTVSWLLVGVK